jgi:cell wall-associated NlpC family hydrolase
VTSRHAIVAEARRWLGTPFAHQGRTHGVGTDCGGLVGGVAVATGVLPSTWWRDVFDPLFAGYGRQPSNGTLERICESFMRRIDLAEATDGDVLLMRFTGEPQHLAIVVPYAHGGYAAIHALLRARMVVEHRLDGLWWSRVVAAFRMPGIV